MKIIILGAGQVGSSVAENLVSEANDITVVDTDVERLQAMQDRLDLRVVVGNGASPQVMRQAGADDADLLIAVTASDQTNLCACRIAQTLFNLPTRIARLRSMDYADFPQLLDNDNFAVDFSICPEQEVTDYLERLIAFPEALQVIEFGKGRVTMVAVRAVGGGPLVGRQVKAMREHLSGIDARIAAIYRRDTAIIPDGNTVIEPGDEVFCLAASEHIRAVTAELRRLDKPMRRIMIAGGGNIGYRLAASLESRYELKLIEHTRSRAEFLSSHLHETLVLAGDTTDEMLLEAENIDDMDLYLALTNDDENNIMSSLMAKRMGAGRVVALINRKAYVDLVQAGTIDIAISPAQVSIGSLLAHVRRGDVVAVHSLRRGAAEALELVVHGDRKTSKVIGRRIEEIGLPDGALIGAIVRGPADTGTHSVVIIPHHDTVIEPEDHVIVFCSSKRLVSRVERLFQVGIGFF